MKFRFLVALLFWSASPAFSLEHDIQVWTSMMFQGPMDAKSRMYLEVSPRFANDVGRMQTIIVRPAYVYSLDTNSSLWAGYAWTPLLEPVFREEQRLWQQYQTQTDLGAHSIVLRFRIEERFVARFPLALRLRAMGRLSHPFWETPWEAIVWNELFINLNSVTGLVDAGLDRNRLFLGVSYKAHDNLSFETGYMLQIVSRSNEDLMTHNLCVFSSARF